jgi:multicomponent Na+:H+ antiporter subunit C
MTVTLVLVIAMAVLFSCGVYLLLERSLTRMLLGFLLLGNALNLLLLVMSGAAGRPPIGDDPAGMADPLPQAFALTAIVITFAVSAFLLALIHRSWSLSRADEVTTDEADAAIGKDRDEPADEDPETDTDPEDEQQEHTQHQHAQHDEQPHQHDEHQQTGARP